MAGKRGPDKKPRKERPNKRALILHSAMRVFSHYGYDGASFDKIAAEAGVVKSLVIKYFGTKENLANLCIHQFVEMFAHKLDLIDKQKNTYPQHVEKVAAAFKRYRSELRFLVGLTVTPAHKNLSDSVWRDLFASKRNYLTPFENQVDAELLPDLLYTMTSLHFNYVLTGNEEWYDHARQTLVNQFLKSEASQA